MPIVTFYFQLHQPFRLHPDTDYFFWEEKNQEIFKKVSEKNYLPATEMFTRVVRECPSFKICLSMSGTFLEQAEKYDRRVLAALQELYNAGRSQGGDEGRETSRVEFLQETYYHSLTGLFADVKKREFIDQVSLHRQKMKAIFGVRPTAFRNTELMYNNDIANVVADMGYRAILCEQRDDMYMHKQGAAISPNAVFHAKGRNGRPRNLVVLPRNRNLSDDIAFRFPHMHITADDYAGSIGCVDGEAVLLGYDYEHIGEHMWANTGIFDFWRSLGHALARHPSIVLANPTEIAERFENVECPMADIHPLATSSWADKNRDTYGWLGSSTQHTLFHDIQALEEGARNAGHVFYLKWQNLTTSDHLYYLHEGRGPDNAVHTYFSPYGSVAAATYLLTRNLDNLKNSIRAFNVIKKGQQTPVIIISPETGKLPKEGMGALAQYISGKSGGMGEVVSALCKGLRERKIPTHLITLNLKRRFQQESHLTEREWIESRHHLAAENIHLVTSAIFENHWTAYQGNPKETAAEFQRQIINNYLKEIRSRYEGRAILHTHDWMAGGALSAYAKLRQIPLIHTVHNTHTSDIPMSMFYGINMGRLHQHLYINRTYEGDCIDAQATAVKNASIVTYVGKKFLNEVVQDHFMDRPFIPWSVRQETKAKYAAGTAWVVPNGISPDMFPENQKENPDIEAPGLAMKFGPNDALIRAKRANLLKFQHQMGLKPDPNAILFYWPSRLDPVQKGIELLEDIALKFVIENADVQIAVVGDTVTNEFKHAEIMGRIACASQGKIAYRGFAEDLCMLGYAAAADVFGASLYEPFGQIDVVGNLYGATATNRNTGGYADKIEPMSLKLTGAPKNIGNGILFQDYDSSALWWGLTLSLRYHRVFRKHPQVWETELRRIMKEARKNWSLENMVAGYITAYERLNDSNPLSWDA